MADNTDPQLNLDEVVELEADALTDEHKAFLEENKDNLTDEQAEKFAITKTPVTPPAPESRFTTPKTTTPSGKKNDDEDPEAGLDAETKAILDRREAKIRADLKAELGGTSQANQDLVDKFEVDTYIRENPDLAKHRDTMLNWLKDPTYKNVPVKYIARIVAGDDMQKLGAKKEREAQAAAASSRNSGSAPRPNVTGAKNWSNATKEEMDAKMAEVLGRGG